MKLSEIIFGHPDIRKDTSLDSLVGQGFSREEAKVISWFNMRINMGKYIGLAGAALILLSIRKGYLMPLPLFAKPISSRLVIGVGLGSYFVGNYLFNYNRRGGNTPIANSYTNNNLIANKLDLLQHFDPFNRKFTKDEVEQMLFNAKLKTYGRKKYIYNPHVHGNDEEAFKAKHALFNSGKHVITDSIRKDIEADNGAKIANNETVLEKPFKLADHLDIHGSKEHIQKFEIFTKRHVL